MDTPPQWAVKKACDLLNEECRRPGYWTLGDVGRSHPLCALARYIATKEEAPVDPLVGAITSLRTSPCALTDEQAAAHLRAELSRRGGRIVFDEVSNA